MKRIDSLISLIPTDDTTHVRVAINGTGYDLDAIIRIYKYLDAEIETADNKE